MFSPPGEPQFGTLLGERTSTFSPQRVSLPSPARLPAPAGRRAGERRSDRHAPGQIVMKWSAWEHDGLYELTADTVVNS